jgi:hypothetical protein
MQLSQENLNALMVDLHREIEMLSEKTATELLNGSMNDLTYPPTDDRLLTVEEKEALELMKGNKALSSAIRKILADHSSSVLFGLFNVIDGTGDPYPLIDQWTEIVIIDRPEDYVENHEMLHDEFYSTYHNWKELR